MASIAHPRLFMCSVQGEVMGAGRCGPVWAPVYCSCCMANGSVSVRYKIVWLAMAST